MRKALPSKYSNRTSMLCPLSFALMATLLAPLIAGCPVEEEPPKPSGVVKVTVQAYSGESSDNSDNPQPDMVNPQLPWITKYHLRFTSGNKNVDCELESGEVDMGEGYMQTLEEGDWRLEVTGYTDSGAAAETGSETFVLRAAEHNIETPWPVEIHLTLADDGMGIFTYTIHWPVEDGVSATLRFESEDGEELTIPAENDPAIQNGVRAYSKLPTGSYDLLISLSAGDATLTGYVLVDIAAGCETTLNYTFTDTPALSDRYLAGKLADIVNGNLLAPNESVWIKAYEDEACTTLYDSYEVLANSDWSTGEWHVSVPGDSSEVYFTLSGKVGGKDCSVPAKKLTPIPAKGQEGIELDFHLTWYVKQGVSGNGGYTTPFGTVQAAVDYIGGISSGAVTGKTIHIKVVGPVNEPTIISIINTSMTGGASIIIEGDGTSPGIINAGGVTGLSINVTSALTVTLGENLTLKGATNGGVYVQSGTFILDGGTISENNSTGDGGGVRIATSATFIMETGSISGNTVTGTGNGGGVYVTNNGTFTMKSGTITGNKVIGTGNGGGVYVVNGAAFNIEDGSISNNTKNNIANNLAMGN